MNFIGTYYHTLEDQGRVSIPKSFRSELTHGAVVTKGLDGCLFVFPHTEWTQLSDKLSSLPLTNKLGRDFLRLVTYNAAPIEIDKLGRTRIPELLQQTANLKKDVVFVGTLRRIELWDKSTYHRYFDKIAKNENSLTSALGDLGI